MTDTAPHSTAANAAEVLVIGFGNPGRGDDGLGPALAERIAAARLPGVEVEIDYQLVVEHAAMVAGVGTVYFLDATVDATLEPFVVRRIQPEPGLDFTSHVLAPGRVLALAAELYGARPEAWLVSIPGEDFELDERLSRPARDRLEAAFEHLVGRIG